MRLPQTVQPQVQTSKACNRTSTTLPTFLRCQTSYRVDLSRCCQLPRLLRSRLCTRPRMLDGHCPASCPTNASIAALWHGRRSHPTSSQTSPTIKSADHYLGRSSAARCPGYGLRSGSIPKLFLPGTRVDLHIPKPGNRCPLFRPIWNAGEGLNDATILGSCRPVLCVVSLVIAVASMIFETATST